ncbi:glycoside hydrolase family 73 protein [Rugamonas rivuli]|uniref:Mannosyl-glycoprotein endo-beta-N-acetylglucosamidase n=1 Tax=Rugamonas rivuli TaxID=2743358 RepID=A0A843SB86_9BURK|nr:glucosaminidase domain-containing protein [Rugamonas rivuli]MQA21755.1 mannosyl-glycoprotein endo-beta-N-acetylglucosamidase [Rugamonas rivuli]
MTPADFIAAVGPAARASAARTRVPASFALAEAALESGWGASQLALQARNLFGVKADPSWRGDVLLMPTREFLKGQWQMQPARWRKYPDWQGCIDDHAAFLLANPRYKPAFSCRGGEAFARAVAAAGYATDPQYADKLIAVMRGRQLSIFDRPEAP